MRTYPGQEKVPVRRYAKTSLLLAGAFVLGLHVVDSISSGNRLAISEAMGACLPSSTRAALCPDGGFSSTDFINMQKCLERSGVHDVGFVEVRDTVSDRASKVCPFSK